MRTNRLHNLDQKPNIKSRFTSFSLAFLTAISLSACGIKGDLYQTPAKAVIPKDNVVEQSGEGQNTRINKSVEQQETVVTTLDDSQNQQAVQPSQTTTPIVKQPTDQVKEQQ